MATGLEIDFAAERPTRVRYVVLAALAAIATISYLARVCFSPAATTIQNDLGLSAAEMGYILSGFYMGYILSQIPGGWLGDRLGARLVLPAFSLAWSICLLISVFAHSAAVLQVSRVAVGIAQGGLFPVCSRVILDWFPESRRGSASAVPTAFMSVGAVGATGLTVALMPLLGWRGVFELYALCGILWALLFAAWYRNSPEQHPATNAAERELIHGIGSGKGVTRISASSHKAQAPLTGFALWAALLTSRSLWAHCFQSIFRSYAHGFFFTWFPAYLEKGYHTSVARAGYLGMVPLASVVVGSLLGGELVDACYTRTGSRWLSRSGLSALVLLICAATSTLAAFVTQPLWAVGLISAGFFCFGLTGPTTWAATMDIGGKQTALVFAVMNMSGNIGAILCPIQVGYLIDSIGRRGLWPGWVLVLIGGICLAGAVSWLLLDPNRPIDARPPSALDEGSTCDNAHSAN